MVDELEAEVVAGYLLTRERLSKASANLLVELHDKLAQLKRLTEEIAMLDLYIQRRVPDYVPEIDFKRSLAQLPGAHDGREEFVLPEPENHIFANMPLSQAVEKFLRLCGAPQTLQDIASALARGGANLSKNNHRPLANLKASISYRNARYKPAMFAVEDNLVGLVAWKRPPNLSQDKPHA